MDIRITIAQVPVFLDINENLKLLKKAVDFASKDNADILLTPEGSLSGYTHLFDSDKLDAALLELESYAKERSVGLALGTCKYEADGKCYNELRFYLPNGHYLGCHTKTLLCGSMYDEPPIGEINDFSIKPLQVFDFNGITIGGLICNDMWANPSCTPNDNIHLTNKLSKLGAKIIFHAVNGGRDASEISQGLVKSYHEVNLLMNAIADRVYIATVDNAFPLDIPVSSYSGIVGTKGKWLHKINDKGIQMESYTLSLSV